ncbi:ABC transporter ATP-binding protein [Methanomassiliicoccus luminyensis]|uniref:ABC transporter ATP-binding protein n=1 Tax=Methanomassiliicoccus luminyensis TaxID=1080712 RepID=UPI0003718F19|nr:ABC transporter ATP-binding protein [Methanomassiliicoccus luminyensis]
MVQIAVNGVRFSYNSSEVLSGVSMEAREGEIIGILGPNGSGKTTLLKCMNRALSPSSGTVLIEGKDHSKMSKKEIALQVGVVPQNGGVNFPFTVLDVVMMGRTPALKRFEPETEQDIDIVKEAMEKANVVHLAGRPVSDISGGEMQRVIIARALAQRPRIMLLDEPTLHLDINHQLDILDLIHSLAKKQKMVVIIVTHDLGLAARYCDHIVLMKGGSVQAAGAVPEVLTSDNMRKVFSIEAELQFDQRTGAYGVTVLRSYPCSGADVPV